jgi:DNA excision repair protein ERCC-4
VFIIDTREQQPYAFGPAQITTVRRALAAGDYSVEGMEEIVAVERKTVEDFVKTVIRERERFDRELEKLAGYTAACVVVEGSLSDLLDANYRCGAHPNSVLGAAMSIIVDRSIPIYFCGDRQAARTFVEAYLLRCARKLRQPCPSP